MKRKELIKFREQVAKQIDKTPPFESNKLKPRGFNYCVVHRSSLHGDVVSISGPQKKGMAKKHLKYLLDFEMGVKRSFHLQLMRCELETWCNYVEEK